MAEKTRSLALQEFAYVRSDHPTTHYTVNENTWYTLSPVGDDTDKFFYGKVASMPASLGKYALLSGITIVIPAKTSASSGTNQLTVNLLRDTYNANTITFDTRPNLSTRITSSQSDRLEGGKTEFACVIDGYTIPDSDDVATFLNGNRAICFDSVLYGDPYISVKAKPTSGTYATRIIVNYDDSIIVKSAISATVYPSGETIAKNAQKFTWAYVKDATEYRCANEKWTQASAIFYWRTGSSGSYNAVNISGSTTTYSIPANTLPTNATIYWYVKGTDTEGTTTQTSVRSFTTAATQITPVTYPTGNSIDNRTAQTFTWDFVSSTPAATGYAQGSASIKWRVFGQTAWNTISASGTTKSKSVPAYTFPANSTIEWYLTGTDYSGASSSTDSSNPYTFKTQGYTLTVTTSPSGSNVDTRSAISFAWTLANASGAATQTSAILYWRVQGAPSYTSITNSTATKSMSVPANTFPTGSTIQWYLSVTAKDGTVLSTNATTFSTVTPKLTLSTYPSGNSVDFGSAQTFTWTIKSAAGDHTQQTATLYWRSQTTDPWSSLTASGSTKSITASAFTFPSGSTIQWYIQATDIGGTVMTSSTQSFKTVSTQITPTNSPTSGYADPRNEITFSWFFSTGGTEYPQDEADFYWRVSGAENWTNVPAQGSTQSVTIAADTFPILSSIEWYLSGTDIGGTYSETVVYTFSTTASASVAICQEPVGRAEDGTKPITLRWIVQNDDGSEPTRTIVRWKLPTESQLQWHEIIDTSDVIYEYTVAARFFSAGPVEWAVVAYNRDDIAGQESQASFVVIDAPDPPSGLTATNVPLTDINWQSSGQQAYEISIDGEIAEKGYGESVYHYHVKEPLSDGVHTISIRIQGSYGLWSTPASTQIYVENVPKGVLTLDGIFHTDASLLWELSEEEEPDTVAVYRDGKIIGTATGNTDFIDRYVLGEHVYRVEYWFSDGYYTRSNDLTGEMSCRSPLISGLYDEEWAELRLSENDFRTISVQRSKASALRQVTGSVYPILEVSYQESRFASFECAFRTVEDAERFESFFGETVIIKASGNTVMVGGLMDVDKAVTPFYIAYSFKLQQIRWEDFVNHDAHN